MSRLARLEGIQTIYPEIPDIQEAFPMASIRLDIRLNLEPYVACSIHRFLWDLTHVFSKIRVRTCKQRRPQNAANNWNFSTTIQANL